VYAVSKKNKPLTGVLVLLMVSQLIFGIFSSIWSTVNAPSRLFSFWAGGALLKVEHSGDNDASPL
jgi:hypothetical protein